MINTLKDKAWATCDSPETYMDKFAELIINDCIAQCDKHDPHPDKWSDREEFTERRTVLNCIKSIKQHFGVK